jgi:hypothetical protein
MGRGASTRFGDSTGDSQKQASSIFDTSLVLASERLYRNIYDLIGIIETKKELASATTLPARM